MAKWHLELLKVAKLERSAERARKGEKGITLSEISDATGIPLSTVSQYIDNRVASPDLDKVARIAAYLGLKTKDLIEVDETGNHSAPRKDRRAERVDAARVPVS